MDGIDMSADTPDKFNKTMAINDLAYRLRRDESGRWLLLDGDETAFEITYDWLDDDSRTVIAAVASIAFVCGSQWASTKLLA